MYISLSYLGKHVKWFDYLYNINTHSQYEGPFACDELEKKNCFKIFISIQQTGTDTCQNKNPKYGMHNYTIDLITCIRLSS